VPGASVGTVETSAALPTPSVAWQTRPRNGKCVSLYAVLEVAAFVSSALVVVMVMVMSSLAGLCAAAAEVNSMI